MNSLIDRFLLAHNQALFESVVLNIVIFVSPNLLLANESLDADKNFVAQS
jgi:hypothetical protein